MYRISPFTYLVDSLLSVGLANTYVTCTDVEFLTFAPPHGETCGKYMAAYIAEAGGYLRDSNATTDCQYCTVYETNVFLASVSSSYDHRYRNIGILFAFVVFNIIAAVGLYWLARVPKKNKEEKVE